MMHDGLTCAFDQCAMGLATDRYNNETAKVSRERQDAFAAVSHERAAAAAKEGRFAEEIVAVEVPQRRGDPHPRRHRRRACAPGRPPSRSAGLRPAFDKEGTITAGNASQISDGGAAVIVTSAAKAAELGVTPLGEFVAYGQVAGPDPSLLLQPAHAIVKAAERAGVALDDIDLFEINEAFAAVGLASADQLGIDEDKLNVNGGAIALGHPVGMSGTRLALSGVARAAAARGATSPRWRSAAAAARATPCVRAIR